MLADKKLKLPWELRISMMRAAAAGLHYLHTFHPGPIIHGNLKSTNILVHASSSLSLSSSRISPNDCMMMMMMIACRLTKTGT